MTKDQALGLLYRYSLDAAHVVGNQIRASIPDRAPMIVNPILVDLANMRGRWPEDGSERKAMRWLGYAQGVLVATGVYSLEEVKEHSRKAGNPE